MLVFGRMTLFGKKFFCLKSDSMSSNQTSFLSFPFSQTNRNIRNRIGCGLILTHSFISFTSVLTKSSLWHAHWNMSFRFIHLLLATVFLVKFPPKNAFEGTFCDQKRIHVWREVVMKAYALCCKMSVRRVGGENDSGNRKSDGIDRKRKKGEIMKQRFKKTNL